MYLFNEIKFGELFLSEELLLFGLIFISVLSVMKCLLLRECNYYSYFILNLFIKNLL